MSSFKITLLTIALIYGVFGQDCPQGWSYENGNCYSVQTTPLDWVEAEKNCENLGGNLASIDSSIDQHNIQTLEHKWGGNCGYFWIGGHRNGNTNTFYWTNGHPWAYTHWGPNDPNPKYNCVGMRTTYYNWHTEDCSYKDCSICEKPYKAGNTGYTCADLSTSCAQVTATSCANYFYQLTCPVSCRTCTSGQTYNQCVDIDPSACAVAKAQECNGQQANWFHEVCPKTCGAAGC